MTMNMSQRILEFYPQCPIRPYKPLDESLARELLAEKKNRITHVLGAARIARELASVLDEPMLETAALFHDVGYSSLLRVVDFHPLDGAIFLAHMGADERIVTAVLGHSGSAVRAMLDRPDVGHFYSTLVLNPADVMTDLVTFCDLRTSPCGNRVTVAERVANAIQYHGPNSGVARNMPRLYPMYQQTRDRVLAMVAAHSPHPLPWLFVDVDSTLVSPGGTLSSRNRAAVMAYKSAGGHVSLATGRHPQAIKAIAEEAGIPGPHLAGNGAIVIENGEYHLLDGIASQVRQLDEYLRAERVPFSIYSPTGVFATSRDVTETHLNLLREINEPEPDRCSTPDWDNVFKILMFIPKHAKEQDAILRRKAAEIGVACVRTSRDFLELISHSSGKAVAMQRILDDARWPVLHTSAIGDSENDLCLLRQSGYAAVVGNASSHVKQIADKILPACVDDGVAEYIESILQRA